MNNITFDHYPVKYRLTTASYCAILLSFIKLSERHNEILIDGHNIRFLNELDSLSTFKDGEIQLVHCKDIVKIRTINDYSPYGDNNKWKQNGSQTKSENSFDLGNGIKCFKRSLTWERNKSFKLWEYYFTFNNENYVSNIILRHFLSDTVIRGNGHNYNKGSVTLSIRPINEPGNTSIINTKDASFATQINAIGNSFNISDDDYYCLLYFNDSYENLPNEKKRERQLNQPKVLYPIYYNNSYDQYMSTLKVNNTNHIPPLQNINYNNNNNNNLKLPPITLILAQGGL